MKDIHQIQRDILIKLLFSGGLTFTDLKGDSKIENSQFVFHLDILKELGYISKDKTVYVLTSIGKEFANRHDSDSKGYKKQAKISVWVAIRRNETEYLIGTRLKNPFFGAQGFLTGKLDYGESIYNGAKREMKEETNLEGIPKLLHIRHYMNRDKHTKAIIEDKFLYLFIVNNPIGRLNQSEEANFKWIDKNNFKNEIISPFDSYEDFVKDIELIENFDGTITFEERELFPDNF